MSDYLIDKTLYKQALDEIYKNFLARNPARSKLDRASIEQIARAHAEELFRQIWHDAVQTNEQHKALVAKRTHPSPETDDNHRDMLLICFVGVRGAETGISKSAAEKLVDGYILPHLAD